LIHEIIRVIFFVTISYIGVSCTKPVDFSQINDLEINPIIETSLVFLDEPVNQFIDNGAELTTVQDFVLIDFLNNEFTQDNLDKAEFTFETTNSIAREFQMQVDFFNESNQQLHSFSVLVEASLNNTNIVSSYVEVFEGSSLNALKATSKLVFTLRMSSGTTINEDTQGRIELKSKATFYFNIKNN